MSQYILVVSNAPDYVCPMKTPISIGEEDERYNSKPFVNGAKVLLHGEVSEWSGEYQDVTSPIIDKKTSARSVIGKIAIMDETSVLTVSENAKDAWKNGNGEWPKMSAEDRVQAMLNLIQQLKKKREEIIEILMWEICKNVEDATAEFDRTIGFMEATINTYRGMNREGLWRTVNGVMAAIRRSAIGIMLCLGPFNYPFNETYAALIPALLVGNIVIMKIPMVGGLAHILTLEIFASALPKGVMSFISGSGRSTVGPLMRSGVIDVFSFIGSSKAADAIIKQHPNPHRLKLFLQLEGKNLGIVLSDADINTAVSQILLGSTSFNGQRCTAIKLIFLHKSVVGEFLPLFSKQVSSLPAGLPWQQGVLITPLPEHNKISFLEGLISDAVAKGAKVVNEREGGGEVYGALMKPAILFPVTAGMRLWEEEQFGPVIPIAQYEDIQEVYDFLSKSPHGLQAAVFTSSPEKAGSVVDNLSTAVGRININTQCARSPDVYPFSARKSSGLGTMSVSEALKTFSIEVVVATKQNEANEIIAKNLVSHSVFLENK
eukprot:CAMPEP_0182416914 /NCGR_PEP_ID=MMETSP1167-20130531/1313_1 /TAXON_ID=2988 /ORGANISM="Mallomonas Sp, Strain CCMP3275" /LENGTH=545 /DNA_ID=CAMNT_0024590095 /DNA_START=69 /DNA_END=1706 /DNA_ORIENTATION=+